MAEDKLLEILEKPIRRTPLVREVLGYPIEGEEEIQGEDLEGDHQDLQGVIDVTNQDTWNLSVQKRQAIRQREGQILLEKKAVKRKLHKGLMQHLRREKPL